MSVIFDRIHPYLRLEMNENRILGELVYSKLWMGKCGGLAVWAGEEVIRC